LILPSIELQEMSKFYHHIHVNAVADVI
jgi:hypothetical protein